MARYWIDFESRATHILNDGLDVAFERNKKTKMTARFRICQVWDVMTQVGSVVEAGLGQTFDEAELYWRCVSNIHMKIVSRQLGEFI